MLAAAAVVSASESVSSVPEPAIGLDAALRQAVQTHPSIRSRAAEVRAAGHDRDAAEWAPYPAFSADVNQTEEGGSQSTARVQLPLWTAGRISGQIELARAGLTAAEFSVIEAEQTVLLQTATAYADLLRAQAKLQAATINLSELERLQALIGRRVGTEISPQADATLASARVQQARTERIQQQNQLASARSALEQAIGRAVREVERQSPRVPDLPELDALMEAALQYSPELARLRAQEAGAQARIDVSRAALAPQLVLTHERRMGDILEGQARDLTYVALQFQPGAGLSAASGIEAAAERRLALRDAIEAARRQLVRQVRTDWSELSSLRAQAQPVRDLVEATREVVESYLRQYTVGRKSWLDVLNAQREATQALYSAADVEFSMLLTGLRLQILSGRLTAQTLVQP